jgi:transposase-like protein
MESEASVIRMNKRRRRYSTGFKHRPLTERLQPITSVAKVALLHRLSLNLVHKWRQLSPVDGPGKFVPLLVRCAAP